MAFQLQGARALVTGATGGIGHAIARRLAREGAELVLTGRRSGSLEALAQELGAQAVIADLARREEVERLIEAAGDIDLLVANAALPGSGRLAVLERAHIDRALEVNLRAPIALAHGLLPGMFGRRRGHLVFIGSLSGKTPNSGASIYSATKFGLRGVALSLRAELAAAGIGVSLVSPGFVSDAGMNADTGIRLPRGFTTRTPGQVADAVVRAVRENRGEIDVASWTARVVADLANLAPELAARAGRVVGADRLAAQYAERQADKR